MAVESISAQTALAMQQNGALILDVREPWETHLAPIAGALNIPMQSLPSSLNALPDDQDILCLCHHGVRSMHVAQFLAQQGFDHIYNITGGSDAWSRSVDAGVARY
jgi:rhodanese-related sulfurtransferase